MAARAARRASLCGGLTAGAALALSLGLQPSSVHAEAFQVTNLGDSGSGSLRAAVAAANLLPSSVITFQSGLSGTITLASGKLEIDQSVEILGPGADVVTIDGGAASNVFFVPFRDSYTRPLDVVISGLKITGGQGTCVGSSTSRMTLDSVVITECGGTGIGGAGGYTNEMVLAIRNSVITGNGTVAGKSYGIDVAEGGFSQNRLLIQDSVISGNHGGGIHVYVAEECAIERSTISGNMGPGFVQLHGKPVTVRQCAITNNTGAGFFQPGPGNAWGALIEDSTISDNGSGVSLYSGAGVVIEHTTISGNAYGGVSVEYDDLPIRNSIVAGNGGVSGFDLRSLHPDLDIYPHGGVFTIAHSLVQNPKDDVTITEDGPNLFGQDPLLGPLGDHGGPTATHVPSATSPVIDAGDPNFAMPGAVDQRGVPRVAGAHTDMGAVERSAGTLQCSAGAISVDEDEGSVVLSVARSGGYDGAASVVIATADGSATQPADYTQAMATLQWSDGDSAPKTLNVSITNDGSPESNELFTAALTNANQAALGATSTVGITIHDDDSDSDAAPTISAIGDQATDEDTATADIAFSIGDSDDDTSALVVGATSSNQELIADADIELGGSGANRTLRLEPSKNANGSADITVSVSDGVKSSSATFTVVVNAVNDAPAITAIPDQMWDGTSHAIVVPFAIDDVDDAVSALSLSATSTDQSIAILVSGSGTQRTAMLLSAYGHSAVFTITVSDGKSMTSSSFYAHWFTEPPDTGEPNDLDAGSDTDGEPDAAEPPPHTGSDAGGGTPAHEPDAGISIADAGGGHHHSANDAGAHGAAGSGSVHADASAAPRDANAAEVDGGGTPHLTGKDCGCSTVGAQRRSPAVVISALLGLIGLGSRRRRRAISSSSPE